MLRPRQSWLCVLLLLQLLLLLLLPHCRAQCSTITKYGVYMSLNASSTSMVYAS